MKCESCIGRYLQPDVALLVSAWIEIKKAPLISDQPSVALLVSAWIEILRWYR